MFEISFHLISFDACDENDGRRQNAEGEGDWEGDDQVDFAFRFVDRTTSEAGTETNRVARVLLSQQIGRHSEIEIENETLPIKY